MSRELRLRGAALSDLRRARGWYEREAPHKPTTGEVFGEHLRELRQKRGLTQVDLAERCGFPQARISKLERGGRTPKLLRK